MGPPLAKTPLGIIEPLPPGETERTAAVVVQTVHTAGKPGELGTLCGQRGCKPSSSVALVALEGMGICASDSSAAAEGPVAAYA